MRRRAAYDAKTGRLGKQSNEEWRPRAPVPFGVAAEMAMRYRCKASPGSRRRLRFAASLKQVFGRATPCGHGVNREGGEGRP